jgi:diguanylate cyclase (GGDEF)-like protein
MSQLLLVSWLGVRQCTWALHPGGDQVTRAVEGVFSYPGRRLSSLIVSSPAQRHGPSPDALAADPRLADAGFDTYAVIETDSDVTYHVFWDEQPGSPENKPAAQTARDTTAAQDHLWRILRAALTNLARLERLRELSHIDFTTGVFNRRYFDLRLTEEINRARRFQRPLSLAVLDIDNFKALNDTYGHQAGDSILRRVAECIRWTTRSIDVFCRLGGDEFAVLMPDANLLENPHLGERLRAVLARLHLTIEGLPEGLTVAISIGGAVFPQHCDDESRLIWCADMALLEAKQKGRDRFILYEQEMGRPGDPLDRQGS